MNPAEDFLGASSQGRTRPCEIALQGNVLGKMLLKALEIGWPKSRCYPLTFEIQSVMLAAAMLKTLAAGMLEMLAAWMSEMLAALVLGMLAVVSLGNMDAAWGTSIVAMRAVWDYEQLQQDHRTHQAMEDHLHVSAPQP